MYLPQFCTVHTHGMTKFHDNRQLNPNSCNPSLKLEASRYSKKWVSEFLNEELKMGGNTTIFSSLIVSKDINNQPFNLGFEIKDLGYFKRSGVTLPMPSEETINSPSTFPFLTLSVNNINHHLINKIATTKKQNSHIPCKKNPFKKEKIGINFHLFIYIYILLTSNSSHFNKLSTLKSTDYKLQ